MMVTVSSETVYTTEVNRSKFITHLVPISEYEGLQSKLKAEHPKANHVVYALRYLNEFDQIVENSDYVIEIPQFGNKHSINVSVSIGVILWDMISKLKFSC